MQTSGDPKGVSVSEGAAIAGSHTDRDISLYGRALSTGDRIRQLLHIFKNTQIFRWLELRLEEERDQLALWVPVGIGTGVAAWFLLANSHWWISFILGCTACAVLCGAIGQGVRLARAIAWFALLAAIGCALIWFRSWAVAAPVLEKPVALSFYGEVERTETISARGIVRLTLTTDEKQGLPPRVRVNVPLDQAGVDYPPGSLVSLRARLMPPASAALPGAYDFSERAWFQGLGATGRALGDITVVRSADSFLSLSPLRQKLSDHVQSRMDGGAGAIGATLATGDRGAISEEDAEAMRRSGLAHLLSISGLHVSAIVGAVYLLVLKLLAAFPSLALRYRLPLVAAGCAALAAIAYTLITGAQVPTIRACVAALLVLAALMMGRNAFTLRMVAAGAVFVLILWPETLVGPSFQLSFAAVTAIIALHEHPRIKALFAWRDEPMMHRVGRIILSLFVTGLVVELALMPIALYHFHKAGIYGALANIIAIPLTTFVIMPLEALALLFDSVGLGAPFWWVCEQALTGLIALAHFVSSRPGAVTLLPSLSIGAFALVIIGGLWICLWRRSWRYWGFAPLLAGAVIIATTRAPDIYITSDGRHVGIRNDAGELAMLRTRSGDFIRDMILENAGIDAYVDSNVQQLEDWNNAQCTADSCTIQLVSGNRSWTLLATRSSYYISALALSAACRRADIVVSERRLPDSCQPRWIKADRAFLRQTGGLTINLEKQHVETVKGRSGAHQWTPFYRTE